MTGGALIREEVFIRINTVFPICFAKLAVGPSLKNTLFAVPLPATLYV